MIIEPIKFILRDIGLNIKCDLFIGNKHKISFNCMTKYESTAEEFIAEMLNEVMTTKSTFLEIVTNKNIEEEYEE